MEGSALGSEASAPAKCVSLRTLEGEEGPGAESRKEAGTPQGLEPWPSSARRATTSAFCFFLLVFSQTQR